MQGTKKYDKYIGRSVVTDDGKKVKIQSLAHSYVYQDKMVVNEEHFVHYLDFFGQMNGEKITDEDRKLFDESFKKERDTYDTKFKN